jgi:hypothetical protein
MLTMKTRENKNEKKSKKNIFNSESAAATVIAAVLLLSITFTILAFVKVAYIPEWKSDAEKLHMSEVQKDMTAFKSMTDLTTSFMASDPDYSSHLFFVTVPFDTGGGEIPILEPSKSSGTLSLNTQPYSITITLNNSSILNETYRMECGGITYSSNNKQFVDQTFRYENGAVIISQENKSLMRHLPFFIIEKNETDPNKYNFSIQAINISGNSEIISSNSNVCLRLNGLDLIDIYNSNNTEKIYSFNCTILTEYPEAWYSYLKENARNKNLEYGIDYILACDRSGRPNKVYFEFPLNNSNKKIESLSISESFINAELGAT